MSFLIRSILGRRSNPNLIKVSQLISKTRFQHTAASSSAAFYVARGRENSYSYENVVKQSIRADLFKSSYLAIQEKFQLNENQNSQGQLSDRVEEIIQLIPNLTDFELVGLINILNDLKDTEQFLPLWEAIDNEGAKRVPTAEPEIILAGVMKMFEMHLLLVKSNWAWAAFRRLYRRLSKRSQSEVLQLMFIANIFRKFPVQYSGYDLQAELVDHFNYFSLDQMAVVAVSFFKCETKLNNKVIMSTILRKLIEKHDEANSFNLAMLSKIIKYSLPVTLSGELLVLQKSLTPRVPQMDLTCLTHVALTGTNVLIFHEPLIRAIVERMKGSISELRLKDLERLLFVLSLYNMQDDDFLEKVVKDLPNREREILSHPKSFVSLVNFLVLLQYFDSSLIDRVLSKKFIKETYGMSYRKIGAELIFIDKSTEIERPDYKGNRLPISILKNSAKVMTFTGQASLTGTQKFAYDLEDELVKLYRRENVTYMTVLPQYCYPDFIIGFNEKFEPQAPPNEWKSHEWGEVKKLPDNKNIWFAVIAAGWNTIIRNTEEPLGNLNAKIRHLKILGYRPVWVPFTVWRKTLDKQAYVKSIIDKEILIVKEERLSNPTSTKAEAI